MGASWRKAPSRWTAVALIGVACLMLLPGPAPASAISPSGSPAGPSLGAPPNSGVVVAPAFSPAAGVRAIGPLPGSEPVSVTVGIALSDPNGLANAIEREYTPGNPDYRHFLTPGEVADLYGATPRSYDSAAAYFRALGIQVTPSPDRSLLFLTGSASIVGAAFGTSFEEYQAGDQTFYSHPTPARLPVGIPWLGAVGLGSEGAVRPADHTPLRAPLPASASPSASCPSSSWVTPCSAHSAYNLSSLLSAGDNGTGERIGIIDAYDAAEPQGQLANDYAAFVQNFSLPSGNLSFVYPIPNAGNLNRTYTGWAAEEALDLEWARAMAPGAGIDMTLAPDTNAGLYESVDWLVAHAAVNVITMSWGENDVGVYNAFAGRCPSQCNASSDGSYLTLHPVLEAAAAEGISVFAASGDCGAADGTTGVSTNYPASDPYVTGVGGTDLTLTSTSGYGGETGWAGNSSGSSAPGCENQGGSGGGFAPFPRPYWQNGTGVPASPNRRGVPDVSMLAGSPGAEIVFGGSLTVEGGTSLASPMWAGIAADSDTYYGGSLGFLNPSLYAIARSGSAASAFHDVSQGWNGYNAGTGWDPVTGLGSPSASGLVPRLAPSAVPLPNETVTLTASPRFGNAPLTVAFTANASVGPANTSFYDIAFGDNNSSRTSSGNVSHTFDAPGVYAAIATAFDIQGNSSISQPIPIVVGGGGPLSVSLNVSPSSPSVGSAVTFRANVTGGSGPYSYTYEFGDGTYLAGSNRSSVTHSYRFAGGFCPVVVVADALAPPDGGESSAVPVAVGSAAAPTCLTSPPLRTSLQVSPTALDLPGGFTFSTSTSGGVPPYGVALASNDPYSLACGCPIFSTIGNHTVRATVSDSLDAAAVATANVTLYPALSGAFTASPASGAAPLLVNFSSVVSGGHLANASTTHWTFGDGTNATGARVAHSYPNPGFYVATALASDGFGGHASAAFLIDAYASGSSLVPVLTAKVAPALDVPAGAPIAYAAQATGPFAPYQIHWTLGNNGSAFGSAVSQTYPYDGCGSPSACPLDIGLGARGTDGRWFNVTIPLAPPQAGNASALDLALSGIPASGTTPLVLHAHAQATGMPSVAISWALGDGTTIAGPFANHTFLTPGNYTVTATATDPYGDDLVSTRAITVTGVQRFSPTLTGGANVTAGLAPLSVRFSATASGGAGGPYSYSWSFGDGTIALGSSATHTYGRPGSYLAIGTATDRVGDPATLSIPLVVYATTGLSLSLSGLPSETATGATFALSVRETVDCTASSLPGCASTLVPVRLLVLESSAPPPTNASGPTAIASPNEGGLANFTVGAPAGNGSYVVYVWAVATGYYGNASGSFAVLRQTPTTRPVTHWFGPMDLAGAVLVAAASAALVAFLLLRRGRHRPPPARPRGRASPSRRRADAAGRRGG